MTLSDLMPWIGSSMVMPLLLHVFRMHKQKSANGQSLIAAIWIYVCVIAWFFYGLSINDAAIIYSNLTIMFGALLYITTIIYYRYIYIDEVQQLVDHMEEYEKQLEYDYSEHIDMRGQ